MGLYTVLSVFPPHPPDDRFQGRSVPAAHLTHINVPFPVLAELKRSVEQVVLLWGSHQ